MGWSTQARHERRHRWMLGWSSIWCSVWLVLTLFESSAHARERNIQVPVTIHVSIDSSGRSVVSDRQIFDSVRRANAELAAFDVELVVVGIHPLRGHTRVESQDQRFDLGRRAEPDGSIHVFFVERVKLPPRRSTSDWQQQKDRRVSGMHWRYRGLQRDVRGHEYLAVAYNAPTTTFVHEVGHAFGLTHAKDHQNLMCSCRRGYAPAFTEDQGRRLRLGAKRFLRRAASRAD